MWSLAENLRGQTIKNFLAPSGAAAACLLMLATACSGPSETTPRERAINTALGDSRFDGLNGTTALEPYGKDFLVTLTLKDPMQDDDYPTDMCTTPHDGPIVSINWVISADGTQVLAVSPGWRENRTCFGPPPS